MCFHKNIMVSLAFMRPKFPTDTGFRTSPDTLPSTWPGASMGLSPEYSKSKYIYIYIYIYIYWVIIIFPVKNDHFWVYPLSEAILVEAHQTSHFGFFTVCGTNKSVYKLMCLQFGEYNSWLRFRNSCHCLVVWNFWSVETSCWNCQMTGLKKKTPCAGANLSRSCTQKRVPHAYIHIHRHVHRWKHMYMCMCIYIYIYLCI